MVNQHNGISHINMSNADPLNETLLCRVKGDGCHMIPPPPLWVVKVSHSVLQLLLFICKAAIWAKACPFFPVQTHAHFSPPPKPLYHSCSSSQPCVSERKQSQISCAGAAAATVPHTRAFSTRRDLDASAPTAAASAPFVLLFMCLWLERFSGWVREPGWLSLLLCWVTSQGEKEPERWRGGLCIVSGAIGHVQTSP